MPPDPRIDKHEVLLEKIVEQAARIEELIKVLSERADQHAKEIKELKESDIETGKALVNMGLRLSIAQWILVSVFGAFLVGIMTYLAGHVVNLVTK